MVLNGLLKSNDDAAVLPAGDTGIRLAILRSRASVKSPLWLGVY